MCRLCKKCGKTRPINDFVKAKDCHLGRAHTCYECNRKQQKVWKDKYRHKIRLRDNERNRQLKHDAVVLFGGKCNSCGGEFPDYVYDFHHIDPNTKEFKPSIALLKGVSEELNECEMLCANCHRIKHHQPAFR